MNKELLNICYKFFNKFITSEELIESLNNINENGLSEEINNLIDGIKSICDRISNYDDEYSINRKNTIRKLIKKLERVPKDDTNLKILNDQLSNLKKELKKENDCYERWFAITNLINDNDYFNSCFDSLSKYELLEFISQYIQAPFPPNLNQEEFNELVNVGIENDEREWLWRLAFNYKTRNMNYDLIIDYFIKIKDDYYIAELISAVGKYIDIDKLINKIDDKILIENLLKRKDAIKHDLSEEQLKGLENRLNE